MSGGRRTPLPRDGPNQRGPRHGYSDEQQKVVDGRSEHAEVVDNRLQAAARPSAQVQGRQRASPILRLSVSASLRLRSFCLLKPFESKRSKPGQGQVVKNRAPFVVVAGCYVRRRGERWMRQRRDAAARRVEKWWVLNIDWRRHREETVRR